MPNYKNVKKNNLCGECFCFNPQLKLTPGGTKLVSLNKWLVKELCSFPSCVSGTNLVRCTVAVSKSYPEAVLYTQQQPFSKNATYLAQKNKRPMDFYSVSNIIAF